MAFTPKQQNWRWYQNNAAEPTVALAAENTAPSVLVTDGIIRLRFTVAETGGTAGANKAITLEYSTNESTWTAFGSTALWNYANGAATGGNTIAGRLLSDSAVSGKYHENGTTQESWGISEVLEMDFALSTVAGQKPLGTYYFRAKQAGTEIPLNAGETHPSLTLSVTQGINVPKAVGYAVVSPPIANISASKAVGYAVLTDIAESINVSKAVAYAVLLESTAEPPYDDGASSGGLGFGGSVVEVATANYQDPAATGGLGFGGVGDLSAPENHQVDGVCTGGLGFGGEVNEQWQAIPNNAVAVKGGTYRISGTLYTLDEGMSYPGIGSIAALVNCGEAPAAAGLYRYDLLSIDASGTITVTAGTEAATPVMPATPTGEIKLDHVLRYYGQTTIVQADIGKLYMAPQLTTLTAAVADDELTWAETSTTITITCRDQYGQSYTGSKVVNAAITTGNGSIAPASRSGSASSFSFTYTRGGNDPGDMSPLITFTSPTGAFCTAFIKLFDAAGDLMT